MMKQLSFFPFFFWKQFSGRVVIIIVDINTTFVYKLYTTFYIKLYICKNKNISAATEILYKYFK